MKRKKVSNGEKNWGGLFNKKRFEWMEEEKQRWLQNLTLKESTRITERFLSSNMFEMFKSSFLYDEPLSFTLGLMRRKNVGTGI